MTDGEVNCRSIPHGTRELHIGRLDGSISRRENIAGSVVTFYGHCEKSESFFNRAKRF